MRDPSARPDFRQRAGARLLRALNPLVRRMISARIPTGAPNVLLTVRGRRSGEPRTVPVGVVEIDGRRIIQSTYGETGWVRNLRAAGEATITIGDDRTPVRVVELAPGEGGAVLRRALERYRRSRLLRALCGPRFRPPVGVLQALRLRVDDTLEEYVAEAGRHPVFELRAVTAAPG